MSFQDGLIDYPILAVASDEQTRSIHMNSIVRLHRVTPTRKKKRFRNGWFKRPICHLLVDVPWLSGGFSTMTPEEITSTLKELFDPAAVQAITPNRK